MKKILSLFLAFSLVVQPAYSVVQTAQPKKKGIITKTKEKWSEMKEAISKGKAVLKANWKCFTTRKGEGCTKDKHIALQIISNFVTGKTEAAKERLLVFLKMNRECWAYLFKDILALIPAASLMPVAYMMLKEGETGVEEAVAVSLQGLLLSAAILFTYELGSEERRALHQGLTFEQKLKMVGKCMLIIGIDIAIVTALTYIIVTMIKREEGREDVQLKKNAASFFDKKISEAKDEEEKKFIKHSISELGKLVNVNEILDPHREQKAMLFVAEKGYNSAASILFSAKQANLNVKNREDKTLLHIAIENGNEEMVKLLIKARADLNLADKNGYTPLLSAIHEMKAEIVKLLLDNGANPNLSVGADKTTALHLVASQSTKYPEQREKLRYIAGLLLAKGANPTLLDADYVSPFELTADPSLKKMLEPKWQESPLAEKAR